MTAFVRRQFLTSALAGSAGLSLFNPALAQLRVDITRGQIEPIPIAISLFAASSPESAESGRNINQIISANLAGSDFFKIVDPAAYIQSPEELRTTPRFADWRIINAQALLSGTIDQPSKDQLVVEFRLWDILTGNQLSGLRYDTRSNLWRRVAHKISDNVYERMTGEPGYFDTRIAYVSQTGPATNLTKRIALMDQDGANHRFLTDGANHVLLPTISLDNRTIAYISDVGRKWQPYLYDLSRGRSSPLGNFSGATYGARFSPASEEMLLTISNEGNTDIYSFDRASRRTRRLTNNNAINTSPDFSPDGQRIVFQSNAGGSQQLYIMDKNGTNVRRISYNNGLYGTPVWSPRGDLIAFWNAQRGFFHIGVMKPDGSDERLLTRSAFDKSPSWAPNGRTILFSRQNEQNNRARLQQIDITGYGEREVVTPQDASDPYWSALIP